MDFKKWATETMVPFMKEHGLVHGTVKNSVGDKAVVKKDKHGFYSVTVTTREDVRLDD